VASCCAGVGDGLLSIAIYRLAKCAFEKSLNEIWRISVVGVVGLGVGEIKNDSFTGRAGVVAVGVIYRLDFEVMNHKDL